MSRPAQKGDETMKPKDIKALQASVRKWRLIARGKRGSRGPDDCELCKLHYQSECIGCPVQSLTGMDGCRGTPYAVWESSAGVYGKPDGTRLAVTDIAKDMALAEANFLNALLPPEHRLKP